MRTTCSLSGCFASGSPTESVPSRRTGVCRGRSPSVFRPSDRYTHEPPGARKSRWRSATLVLAIVALTACDRGYDDPLAILTLTLTAPDTVRAGTEAAFTLTLGNPSKRTVSFPIGADSGYVFDIVVRGRGGMLVWRRLGSTHHDEARGYDLAPGETVVLEASWGLRDSNGHPVAPGDYSVEALLVGPGARSATASPTPQMHVR